MARTKPTPEPTYRNNTPFTPEQFGAFIGETVNGWRQRVVTLYAHPTDATRVISVGYCMDGSGTIVCDEPRSAWTTALDYIAHGKVYHSQ